jgi:hypothetical protein
LGAKNKGGKIVGMKTSDFILHEIKPKFIIKIEIENIYYLQI